MMIYMMCDMLVLPNKVLPSSACKTVATSRLHNDQTNSVGIRLCSEKPLNETA